MSELENAIEVSLICSKLLILQSRVILHKEVHGPLFTPLKCMVGSVPTVEAGLHAVNYFVVRGDGLPIGQGLSVAEALAKARAFLNRWDAKSQDEIFRQVRDASVAFGEEETARRNAEWDERRREQLELEREERPKQIPKRRRQVFEKSDGKCHYCGTVLTIDGKWHIEHKMPRALLGGNELENLAASCVPCNMRKKDKTDLEFIEAEKARQGARA